MKKLERDSLLADRGQLDALFAELPDEDLVGRLSLEARLREVNEALATLAGKQETLGQVALFFAGGPVLGSRAIDADFATKAISTFQDLLTKRIASEERGKLGARGKIPLRTPTALAIRDVVRGSMGFVLEEHADNGQVTDSVVKKAIAEITDTIAKTAATDDAAFEEAVEGLDGRLLGSLRDFFQTLDDRRATLRIVEDEREETLNSEAVHRGRLRVESTEIAEIEGEVVSGELMGLMPDSRRFEMRLDETGELIKGSVLAEFTKEIVQRGEAGEPLIFKRWRAKVRIREIRERNKPPRRLYTLLGLLERIG